MRLVVGNTGYCWMCWREQEVSHRVDDISVQMAIYERSPDSTPSHYLKVSVRKYTEPKLRCRGRVRHL